MMKFKRNNQNNIKFDYEKNLYKTAKPYNMKSRNLAILRLRHCLESFLIYKKKGKLLEVGCGQGSYIATLSEVVNELKYIGFDISKKAILNAKKSHRDIDFLCADAQEFPFKDRSFDVIVIIDVLEHIANVRAGLQEVYRVLREDGVFHCHVPCEGGKFTWTWLAKKIGIFDDLKFKYGGHIQQFKEEEIVALISENFAIKKIRYSFHPIGQLSDFYISLLNHLTARANPHTKFKSFFIKSSRLTIKLMRKIAYYESLFLQNKNYFAMALHIDAVKK